MSRLPSLRYDDLDPRGREVWDGLLGSRGRLLPELVTADGGLAGPFNAFVTAPGVGRHLSALGGKLRFGSSIEPRLAELAIITTGARWKAEFEWWAHAALAREQGIAGPAIEAIARGAEPPLEARDERTVYAVARQLATAGTVEAATYEAARELLGDAGLVELVALCGYYTLICYVLNAFEVPLPPGAEPVWDQGSASA